MVHNKTAQQDIYSAAEAIDAMLEEDDGAILAGMARYKASIIELFGRDGIVEILRSAVDAAAHVEYFSRRSRREIDPGRPEVNLRVDHDLAVRENETLGGRWDTASRRASSAMTEGDLLAVKADVIHEEVCRAMTTTMNEALIPHWERSKTFVAENQKDRSKHMKLFLCTLFSVRIGTDASVAPADRMCSLIVFI